MTEATEKSAARGTDVGDTLTSMLQVARLALRFGEIKRTAVRHADQVTPESDAEHTVMLAWIAPSIAARLYPQLDPQLVASLAQVHDMPEVYAGDTPTLRITEGERIDKAAREAAAVSELFRMLNHGMPWLVEMMLRYEAQLLPEARFVKALDKLLPKLVHIIDQGVGLREQRFTRAEFMEKIVGEQRASLATYTQDFPELLELHGELCALMLSSITFYPE